MKRLLPLLLLLAGSACTSPSANLTYSVTGTNGATQAALITYAIAGGSSEQQATNAALPWTAMVAATKGDFLDLTAENGDNAGCVTAMIQNGTTTLFSQTTCGAFSVATATGTF